MILTVLLVLSGMLVGWIIGANNAANCLGTSVGAEIISIRKAVWIVAVFALFGAALQGEATMDTVGNGIVGPMFLSQQSVIAILLGAGLLVTFFTIFGLPVSTTQAVIGGIAGIGLMLAVPVEWFTIGKIMGLGFLTPLFALVISYITYKLFQSFTKGMTFLGMEKLLGWIVLGSGAFLAYSLGANNIGNAMGLVVAQGIMVPVLAGVLGGLALGFGSLTLGRKVMQTVGKGITELDPIMAFTAQTGAAATVYVLALIGIPTSTSFAIVGGIAGTGLVKGLSAVHSHTLKKIFAAWLFTPVFGAVTAALIYKLFIVIGI